jgi:signal transduction histidine kinase
LLIPFHRNGARAGTLWDAAHDDDRRFDAEGARRSTSSRKLAAAVCEVPAASRSGTSYGASSLTLRNAVELLKVNPIDALTRRSITEVIDHQISGMTRLIDDLVDVARLQDGNFLFRRTRAAVSEIIEHAVERVRPLAAARDHTLIVSVPPEPIAICADVLWLSQALQNLLGNAAKYTNPDGVIGVNAEQDEDHVVITVSDNGIGIAAAELDTLFELNAQSGQGPKERSAANEIGLGLYLARLIVEGHGGVIRALSAGPDCGSELIVSLPIQLAPCFGPRQPADAAAAADQSLS